MTDPLIIKALSLAFGVLLIGSAWHKAAAHNTFRAVLADYQLLPAALIPLLAILMPLVEAAMGVTWLAGFATETVAVVTAALLLVYAVAIAINLLRGRVHITCGCGFGGPSDDDEPLSWWLVGRNLLLIALASLCATPSSARDLGAYDWLTVAGAMLAAILLYLASSQLLRNRAAIRSWRIRRD